MINTNYGAMAVMNTGGNHVCFIVFMSLFFSFVQFLMSVFSAQRSEPRYCYFTHPHSLLWLSSSSSSSLLLLNLKDNDSETDDENP
jgi:hypothetical protein